jgi:hypothetical protein
MDPVFCKLLSKLDPLSTITFAAIPEIIQSKLKEYLYRRIKRHIAWSSCGQLQGDVPLQNNDSCNQRWDSAVRKHIPHTHTHTHTTTRARGCTSCIPRARNCTSCVKRCLNDVYQLRPELSTPSMTSCVLRLVTNCTL